VLQWSFVNVLQSDGPPLQSIWPRACGVKYDLASGASCALIALNHPTVTCSGLPVAGTRVTWEPTGEPCEPQPAGTSAQVAIAVRAIRRVIR